MVREVVAKGIRFEINPDTGVMYLIFEITNEDYKQYVYKNWSTNHDLELDGKNLLKGKE
jgi:hypothetical protein